MAYSPPLSLALSGSVDESGTWSLFASGVSKRLPRNDPPGEFTVALFDEFGVEMYRQSLGLQALSHSARRSWAVRVPMQVREVHDVRVRDSSGDLRLDASVDLPGRGEPLRLQPE